MAASLESHNSSAVAPPSNSIHNSSSRGAWVYDLGATEVHSSLQRLSATSLSVDSNADRSRGTCNHSATGSTAAAAASARLPSCPRTPLCVSQSVAVASISKEPNCSRLSAAVLDEDQRRCINKAYHISFRGDPRIKLKPTAVVLPNGVDFLIIDRFLSGNSDGVYVKNKKIWEQIPVGQARVFVRTPTEVPSLQLNGRVGAGDLKHKGSCSHTAMKEELQCSPTSGSPTKSCERSSTRSPPTASSPAPNVPRSGSQSSRWESSSPHLAQNEWTRVAASVGLRKLGHWREATNVFSIRKEVSKRAIALVRVDGEPGRIAAFSWLGERYWVIGCRYQHIVTRLKVPEEDLLRYGPSTDRVVPGSSSSSSAVSDDAFISSKVSFTERTSASPSASFPTQNASDDVEQGSVRSTLVSSTAPMASSNASADAAYMDLTFRMARLWRQLLESLCVDTESTPTTLGDAFPKDSSDDLNTDALLALHDCVAADNRSLCFDVILSGWERLQGYSTTAGLPSAASMTTTPATSRGASPGVTGCSDATSCASTMAQTAIPLWFYAITWDTPLDERGWCMDVRRAFSFFRRFRLPTVSILGDVLLDSIEYEALRQSLMSRCDTAGAVLYGSNKAEADDGEGAVVVQVWKCRAYPHSLERVVQEYVVTHRLVGEPLRSRVRKKIGSLSRETRQSIKQWELCRLPFLFDFARWLHHEKFITHSTDLDTLKAIRGHWLTYQERYQALEEAPGRGSCGRASTVSADGLRFPGRISNDDDADNGNGDSSPPHDVGDASSSAGESLDSIMLIGPQGCGKSTLARILYALLEQAGGAPRWLNQDEAGSRSAYLASIRRAVGQGHYSHLLLDKMNLDDKSRSDYTAVGLKPVLVVAWIHTSGAEAMVEVCYDRVVQRGACHRNFCAEDAALLRHPASLIPSLSPIQQGGLTALSVSGGTPVTSSVPLSPLPVSDGQTNSSLNLSFPAARVSSPPPPSRLHGILQASTKRYQVPLNAPLVELDVTWSLEKTVAVVWEALREKGTCVLPPLADLEVEAALSMSYAYEQLLGAYPSFVEGAVLRGPSSELMLEQLCLGLPLLRIPKAQRVQPNVELPLHNFYQQPSPTMFVRYARQAGRVCVMNVQAVVSNSKATLLLISGPTEAAVAVSPTPIEWVVEGETPVMSTHTSRTRTALFSVPPGCSASGEAATVHGAGTAGVSAALVVVEGGQSVIGTSPVQDHFAVLAKANVTSEYCEALARRVRNDPHEDPYCSVQWLSTPMEVNFTVTLRIP